MTSTLGKRKPLKKAHGHGTKEEPYVDLGEMTFDDESLVEHSGSMIKVAEIYRFEDLKHLTKLLYEGHTLLIDYTSLANDDLALRRIISELHAVVEDLKGDVAGVGHNLLVATTGGITVDRNKIRGSF